MHTRVRKEKPHRDSKEAKDGGKYSYRNGQSPKKAQGQQTTRDLYGSFDQFQNSYLQGDLPRG
jgi:hypothetical protein